MVLKSLEYFLLERYNGFSSFLTSLAKTRTSFEAFQVYDGSLRQALDCLFVFMEQELQQARQQSQLNDIRKKITEVKNEAARNLSSYNREIINVKKEVATAEKKLSKSKDMLEKVIVSNKKKQEAGDSLQTPYFVFDPGSRHQRDDQDSIEKYETEMQQDVRSLLRAYSTRDQVLATSRKAYQRCDLECRRALSTALKAVVEREKDAAAAHMAVLAKLEAAVEAVNPDSDQIDVIVRHRGEKGALQLYSTTLSLLGGSLLGEDADDNDNNNSKINSQPVMSMSPSWRSRRVGGMTTTTDGPMLTLQQVNVNVEQLLDHIVSRERDNSDLNSLILASGGFATVKGTSKPLPATSHTHHKEWVSGAARRNNLQVRTPNIQEHTLIDAEERRCQEAVRQLSEIVLSQEGRGTLLHYLNQLRSKKVDVGDGYEPLSQVLWSTLDACLSDNDVRSAKTIMMMSQTFYRMTSSPPENVTDISSSLLTSTTTMNDDDYNYNSGGGGGGGGDRMSKLVADSQLGQSRPGEGDWLRGGSESRQYVKDSLVNHSIWKDSRFWEQALWQLIQEQLKTIQMRSRWYELSNEDLADLVRRVHEVIFSQLMAIGHSMMELNCSMTHAKEFVTKMCQVHQLPEALRHLLINHLNRRSH